ncbi:MAG: hypothetical protein ACHQ4H_11980 [Ktedonobacterales bacterium]
MRPALVVLGDLTIQGNIFPARSLAEPLQVAMDNGAKRALIPVENTRSFLEVAGDVVVCVAPIFYSEPLAVALKALGAEQRATATKPACAGWRGVPQDSPRRWGGDGAELARHRFACHAERSGGR